VEKKHYLIIGAGIIGSSIAREISRRGLGKVTVLEKEQNLGMHASGRNSGVVHSGINQKPGSIKAELCLKGNALLKQFCRKHKVRIEEVGTLVISNSDEDDEILEQLMAMGKRVGVPGLKIIDSGELKKREPEVVGRKALLSPSGAIVDSIGFLEAVVKDAKKHGAEFIMGAKVSGIHRNSVKTRKEIFEADHIINCAGLYSDKIAHMMEAGKGIRIVPFRGEYMEVENLNIQSMVYQAPDLNFPFLKVHLTRTVDGKVLAGPTATLAMGREAYRKGMHIGEFLGMASSVNFMRLILRESFRKLVAENAKVTVSKKAFLKEIQVISPSVKKRDLKKHPPGIRAQPIDRKGNILKDMLVEFNDNSTHILNAVSPGLTASLAFAEYVVDRIENK
jgi:L-2-hydroxyglutarate oxidase|tara:strand:+ start:10656 stop:11831 length:1176 start_codon:yes stop_codon:yes gene_type:complete